VPSKFCRMPYEAVAVSSMGNLIPCCAFDNTKAGNHKTISEYSSPKLTTIYQHGSEIGNRSVELLVDRMNSKWFGLETKPNSFTTEIIPTITIGGGSKQVAKVVKK